MNLQQIEVFLEIAETGSFTAAGNNLGYTQSRITQMMKALEEEFGFRLFIKDHFGSSLSEAGLNLLPTIRQLSKDKDHVFEKVSEINGLRVGSLQLGTYLSCEVNWIPDVLSVFHSMYPNISINISETGWQEIRQGLKERTLDIGFISNPFTQDLEFLPLYEDPIVTILPKGHPLTAYERIPVKEIENYDFILSSIDYDNDITRVFGDNNVTPKVSIYSSNDFHQIQMVRNGLGIGMLPQMILDCYKDSSIVARPLDPPQSRVLGIALPSFDGIGPITREFIRLFKDYHGIGDDNLIP